MSAWRQVQVLALHMQQLASTALDKTLSTRFTRLTVIVSTTDQPNTMNLHLDVVMSPRSHGGEWGRDQSTSNLVELAQERDERAVALVIQSVRIVW